MKCSYYVLKINDHNYIEQSVNLDLRPRVGVYSNENSPFAINAQSPNKPRLLAEKGGRIFARVRYMNSLCTSCGC